MKNDYISFMKSLIKFVQAKIIVEIGVRDGNSSLGFAKYLKSIKGGKLYGFDIWDLHGLNSQFKQVGSKREVEEKLKAEGFNDFVMTQIDTINNRGVFEKELSKNLNGEKVDFAFVDACHSYIGIKNDFEVVYPHLSDTGIVAFHDTLMIDGCREFVFDLRTKFYDGTYDIIDFPYGMGERRCGVSFLIKRSFPLSDRPIDQICGSPSSPDDIELNEVNWLNSEIEKYKDHNELNNKLTNEDMNSILNSGEYRPKRKRRFIN